MTKNRKLKVGLVFDDSLDKTDGVAQYVKTLGAWLSGQGHSVSYLVGETKMTRWQGGQVYSLANNASVKFNGNRLTMPVSSSKKHIKRVLDEHGFDVLHVMVPYSPLMASKIIKAAETSTAVVGTFHIFPSGGLSRVGSRLLAAWLRPTLGRFDEIVSVSQAAAGFAKSAFGIDSQVVPNPVNVDSFKTPSVEQSAQYQVVFLGRLVKRKGAEQLIKAFAELSKTLPQAQLSVAGDGPQRRQLEKLVSKLGLSERVRFLGFIPESQKPALLAGADVACFPSLYGESFGIVLIEAMAAGAATVLGGDNPGYRSVLGDRPELLVNPDDTAEFADRLNQLLTDKKLALEIHEWQTQTVKQYDIELVGARIEAMYQSQIAKRSKKRHN
jgi:phosphatidylinositol alpha-mannosyltransferase